MEDPGGIKRSLEKQGLSFPKYPDQMKTDLLKALGEDNSDDDEVQPEPSSCSGKAAPLMGAMPAMESPVKRPRSQCHGTPPAGPKLTKGAPSVGAAAPA